MVAVVAAAVVEGGVVVVDALCVVLQHKWYLRPKL